MSCCYYLFFFFIIRHKHNNRVNRKTYTHIDAHRHGRVQIHVIFAVSFCFHETMDYLLGVLYATKKYEFLDTSRLQQSTNAGTAGEVDGDVSDESTRDAATSANLARRSTVRPFVTVQSAEDPVRRESDADAALIGGVLSMGDNDDNAASGPASRRVFALSMKQRDPRRLSSSVQEGNVGSGSAFSPPREGGCALSPILPGLSVSTAAVAAIAAATTEGATAAAAGGGGSAAVLAGMTSTIARPQRLECNVPTKVLAGKYVLVYLPSPHRPATAGQLSQVWTGVVSPNTGSSGGGGGGGPVMTSANPSGTGSGGGGGGAGGGGNRNAGPPPGTALLTSPQMEPLKGRLGGPTSAASVLSSVSPHTMPQGGAGRPNFTSALNKSSDPLSSGVSITGHPHSHNAPLPQLPPAALRAAAKAATTQQKLLLFYCLLLRRLAHRPAGGKPLTTVTENKEGLNVTTAQVPVAVLELHYTTEGPLRNNIAGPATAGGGSSQGTADGHGGTASSASPAGGGGGGGAGGVGGGSGGPGGPSPHGYNVSLGSSLTSFNYPTPFGTGLGGGGGTGRSSSAYPTSSVSSAANLNMGGYSSAATSATASPRLQSPAFGTSSVGGSSPRLDGRAADDAAAEPIPGFLLTTILRHLAEGKPDALLSPDNVVFDGEITRNPYYGGWYSAESNDGYRRVMQLCGIQAWPVVVLFDPAGNIVTVAALQHVEEELAQFTAEVERNMARATVASAVVLAEAVTAQNLSPTNSPSPPPPIVSVEGQEGAASPPADEAARATNAAEAGHERAPNRKDVPSPLSSISHEATAFSTGTASENNATFTTSPLVASSSPAAQDSPAVSADNSGVGRGPSLPDRSSTNQFPPAAAEGAALASQADDAYTPAQLNTSKSTSADLHEPSTPLDDPQVPTAEPTPVKAAPATARYHDDRAVSAIPLSEEMLSPQQRQQQPERGSDDQISNALQECSSPGTIAKAGDSPYMKLRKDAEVVKPGDTESCVARTATKQNDDNDSWTKERQGGSEETNEKSSLLSVRPMSQLSMPVLQDSRAATNASCNSYSPLVASVTKAFASLPSWNPKAYGGDVAGVIAVHGVNSEVETVALPTSQSPLSIAAVAAAAADGDPKQKQSQQPRPRQDSLSRSPAAATGPRSPDRLISSLSQRSAFGEGSQKGEGGTSTSKASRDFVATASGVSGLPPVTLPDFASQFPWNLVMPEPIMVYATPTTVKRKEDSSEEGNPDSVQKTFQRHLQERVEGHKRRVSSASRATGTRQNANIGTNRGDGGGGGSSSSAADRCANRPVDVGGQGNARTTTTTAATVAATLSACPAASSPNSSAAAMAVPAAMVLRQSAPSGNAGGGDGAGGAGFLDGGESPTLASGDSAAPHSALVRVPTAQLELATFAESSPLVLTERSWPVHPLRRLAFCSITVEEVVERARSAANHANHFSSNEDSKAEQGGSPAAPPAANTIAIPAATPNSAVMLSLSIGDSTDDDGGYNRTSRSPSPPSQLAGQSIPQPRLSLVNAQHQSPLQQQQQQQQKAPSMLLEGWLQDAATKFESSTHLLLLFGAGWHPGMARCVRALRRLQASVNDRSPDAGDKAAAGRDGGMDGGDKRMLAGSVSRRMNGKGFDMGSDANADVDDTFFPSMNGFNNSSVEWPCSGLDGGGRLDMRGFGNFNVSEGETAEDEGGSPLLGRTSSQRGRAQSTSPSGVLAVEPPRPPPADGGNHDNAAATPRYHIQVIYIGADESLQEVSAAVAAMPPSWLCLSPHVAQSVTEQQLQRQACDTARRIFRVASFPQVVVVELPTAQQTQDNTSDNSGNNNNNNVSSDAAAKTSEADTSGGGGGGDEVVEEANDEAFGMNTSTTMSITQRQQAEQELEGLWTVVQLHGETQLNADPDGKQFPWSSGQSDVLRITQDEVSALPREGQRAWSFLVNSFHQQPPQQPHEAAMNTTSLHLSTMMGCSSPEDVEEPSLSRSHPEMLVTVVQANENANDEEKNDNNSSISSGAASITRAPSPPPVRIARRFPPLKSFAVGDGELPALLERGGYFVVLGAFGSIDAQLHQQCVSALEEVRTWFYAEVEARKEQAWSEPTRLQVMAPHGTYATSFTVGGDRVVLSPAAVGSANDEYGTPIRYSPGVSASAALGLQGSGSGSATMASALRMLHVGGSGNGVGAASKNNNGGSGSRCGPPFLPDEGWPENRAFVNTSPKFSFTSPPLNSSPNGPQPDGTVSVHNMQLSHGYVGAGATGGGTPPQNTAARPLPSVFFYDSILTNPRNTCTQNNTTAASLAAPAAARATSFAVGDAATDPTPHQAILDAASTTTPAAAASPDSGAVNAASVSPAPVPHVSDNTASLRRHHAADLALLQEYILAPILENDEKMLPVREGEVYLALVRWPQRTAAVLRRRLASEVKVTAAAPGAVAAAAAGASGATASGCATPSGGVSTSSPVMVSSSSGNGGSTATTSRGAASTSHSPGQTQLVPEALLRRQSASSSPLSSTVAATASTAASPGHPGTQAPSASAASASPAATTTERGSPLLTAVNAHTPEATSLSATVQTEESGKEGSPDPDATPLVSAEAIKSFLYEQILRSMMV